MIQNLWVPKGAKNEFKFAPTGQLFLGYVCDINKKNNFIEYIGGGEKWEDEWVGKNIKKLKRQYS